MSAAAWKGKVDFGIITIREDECGAVLERFPEKIETISGHRVYRLRRLTLSPTETYTVAILRCIEQGNGEAHDAARDLLEDLAPRWLFVVGIAGGVPAHEFSLGDVIVSTRIVDFSVEAVLKDHSREYTLAGGPLHRDAAKLAADIRAMVHDGELGNWNDAAAIGSLRPSVEIADDRFYGDEAWKKDARERIERHFDGKPARPPLVTTGAIASSDRLIKEAEILQVWLKIARQIQAVEMESSGIYRATQGRVPFLAIRGISDVVGFKRHEDWTEYACHTAAAFLVAFLRTRPIPPRGDERPREAAASHGTANEVKAGSVSLMSNVSAGSGKDGPGGDALVESGTGWGGANGGDVFVGPGDYRAGDGGAGPGGNLTIKGGDAFASPPPTAAVRSSGGAPARTDVTPLEAMKAHTGPTYEPLHHESALEQRLRGFPRRPIHRLTRPPPPGCPRDALLDELARGLHPPSHCVALLGPPGTGRRWLARTHALTRAAAYTTIWQIRGSNRTTIALDLAELAVEIGIAELSSDRWAARDVGLWLRQAPDWLLIIEDLGSLDDLHSLVPLHGPGHVLLVGAPSLDLPEWIERVTVPALDQDDATNLLRAAAGWSEETSVHELLTEYGTLPGELRWAGQLAQLFGHNPAQLLASLRSLSDGRYGALVEYVQRSVTVSAQLSLLTLCAYLGPVPIPVAVLDQMYRSGPDRIREVLPPKDDIVQSIARLEELGLLTCNVGHLHVDTKIVRALRWSTSDRCESWENIVLALVATLVDGNEFVRVADFDLDVAFVPLLRHVIDHIACNDHRQDAFARALSISAVAYEKYSDEPHAAIRDYERAIELIEHCKTPNTFNLATMYLNVGRMHGRQGKHADAIAAFTRARSILATAPTKNRKFRYVLTHYIAESQTHLRLLEAAAASWSTCFAELDELDEPNPLDLLTTLDSYCESLPWPNEGHGELAADALVHLSRVRIHLRPDQRGLFALIAARTAAHLFSLNLHEPGERMLSLSWQEAATLSAPQRAQHALITAFTLQGHDQVDQSTHARARADALLFDSDIGAAQRAWLFCDHAARLAGFGDYADARRHWVLALEALEVQPDAQLTAAAKLGLAESLVELGELDAAQTLCETTLATLDGEQSESMFFRMLDLNGRRVSSEPQRAMATYETLVVMAEERFGSSAPATQVARGTAAQVMMDHGEPLQALPYARSFADVLLAEPFAPGVQARALGVIIRLQFRCGDAEAARAMLGKIIDLLEARPPIQPDDMREASGLLSQLGVDFASRGMFRLGLEAQVRGFVLHRACQSVADEQTLGRASNVGVTLERLGRLEDAHEWYQRTARQARAISHLRWHEVSEVNAVRVQQALARAGRRVSSS